MAGNVANQVEEPEASAGAVFLEAQNDRDAGERWSGIAFHALNIGAAGFRWSGKRARLCNGRPSAALVFWAHG